MVDNKDLILYLNRINSSNKDWVTYPLWLYATGELGQLLFWKNKKSNQS